jgi:hypothetical protein
MLIIYGVRLCAQFDCVAVVDLNGPTTVEFRMLFQKKHQTHILCLIIVNPLGLTGQLFCPIVF